MLSELAIALGDISAAAKTAKVPKAILGIFIQLASFVGMTHCACTLGTDIVICLLSYRCQTQKDSLPVAAAIDF